MAERGHSTTVKGSENKVTFRNVQLLKKKTLGTGAYGAVCKAKCDQLICAAKLLYPVLFQMQAPDPGKEHRQPFHRFEIECLFLSQISHPNIVQYLGTYRDPETNAPVLLMELMDENLTHFLESSPGDIPYHIQVNLSQDIAQALAFLHANGIIHRDLSSNNVLLIAGSRAKVSDFGMSKFTDLNTTHLATMTKCPGTPAFMSPEALDEPPVYTEKLDTFSFGVLLVQISTRQFPEPTDRFQRIEMPNPGNPSHKVKLFAQNSEFTRRQAHISLIDPTHPLLPIALECLKDEAVERPSSEQLCQSLDVLKGAVKYQESQQDIILLSQEQLKVRDQQIQVKDRDLQALKQEKYQQSQNLQALKHEVEAKEHQLRRLHQQLESNEEITATLQQNIIQRDRKIAELEQLVVSKGYQEPSDTQVKEALNSKDRLSVSWEILPMTHMKSVESASSATLGDKAYFISSVLSCVWEFTPISNQWNRLPDPPVYHFSLVNIENELVTVGGRGQKTNWFGHSEETNKLYNYTERNWVEKYPPMSNRRYSCATVYTSNALIVAGGVSGENIPLTAVEILNIHSKRWSNISSLPTPAINPSVSIFGGYIYLFGNVLLKCSILSLVLSTPKSITWEEIASLPVKGSTLVTVKGHLLAVGGESAKGDRCKEVRQYNPDIDSWQVISQMNVARSHCAAALLQDNKLMVVGGVSFLDQRQVNELATVF